MQDGVGQLFIVATPIGNLKDITFRAVEVLRSSNVILAEDTRSARTLLERYGILHRPLSCFAGNETRRAPWVVSRLQAGDTVSLISEAGTPGLSDPGAELVRVVVDAGYTVSPVPGPSSVMACLCVSGFKGRRVLFAGFLPRREGRKRREFLQAREASDVLVFFEHAQRMAPTLSLLRDCLQDPPVVIGREMTKMYEEFMRGSASCLAEVFLQRKRKGEMVVVVGLAQKKEDTSDTST